MIIENTPLNSAKVIIMEPIQDERGFFARAFCKKTLVQNGIYFDVVQCNVAFNRYSHTLRGMHFQKAPYCEDKIVSCSSGAIYDVIIDLNRDSSTFGNWFGVELTEKNNKSLYIPKGFAHGYQTLTDNACISYMVSEYYTPSHESGVRWNDKLFNIKWPYKEGLLISEKDQDWRDFDKSEDGIVINNGGFNG